MPTAGPKANTRTRSNSTSTNNEAPGLEKDESEENVVESQTREETVAAQAGEILENFAEDRLYQVDKIRRRFPTLYLESYNSVLVQECERYVKLITRIRDTLEMLQRAAMGAEAMSDDIEDIFKSMENNRVPALWKEVSYGTERSLGGYVQDLVCRLAFFDSWIEEGKAPDTFWLSGFFFTHAVLTVSMRIYTFPF